MQMEDIYGDICYLDRNQSSKVGVEYDVCDAIVSPGYHAPLFRDIYWTRHLQCERNPDSLSCAFRLQHRSAPSCQFCYSGIAAFYGNFRNSGLHEVTRSCFSAMPRLHLPARFISAGQAASNACLIGILTSFGDVSVSFVQHSTCSVVVLGRTSTVELVAGILSPPRSLKTVIRSISVQSKSQ